MVNLAHMHLYIALSLILLSSVNTVSTVSPPPSFQEQTNFGIEDPVFDRPIDLPDAALPALRADDRVLSCEHTPDNGDPQSHWFIASKIHLAGRGEHDLIVETRHGGRNHKLGNSCLYGANIGPFWVLRFHDSRYEVVLSISALGLNILPSKHNHFKDIETGAVIGNRYVSTLIFHFDGAKYVQAGVRNELIEGAPKDCDQ